MKMFKLLGRFLKKHWLMFVFSIVTIIVLNYIRSIVPKLTGVIIAIVNNKELADSNLPIFFMPFYNGASDIKTRLIITGFIIGIVALIREIINIISDVAVYKLSEDVGNDVKVAYFKKVQDLPYTYLNHASTGDLIQRSTQDVDRFKRFISGSLIDLFTSFCKVIIYGIAMLFINAEFSLYVFIVLPIYFISSYFYFKKQSNSFEEMEEKESKATTVLQENLTGIRVVKAFANEEHENQKFSTAIDEYSSVWKKVTYRMSIFWGISDILTYVQLLVVFILSVIFITTKGMSFDDAVILFLYTEQIAWPCRNLGRELAEWGKTSICCNRILEILDKDDEYQHNEKHEKPVIEGKIVFDHVSFKFDDASIPTLKDINLSINAGDTIAIIGKTGSGKSTFVNLLNRLIDPTEGHIYLDGNDITTIDKSYLREHVGVILQEPFLFSKTIEENINITLPYDDKNKAKELAILASVDDDINSLTLRYETMVGERGVTLSGGQKQRISIARMLATKKEILVFDDSLSALDSETDLKIRTTLKEKEGSCTMLIITHRIQTAKDASKIIVFEDGKITAMGTHDELIKKDGLYKTIYDIQNYFNESEVK